MRAKRVYVLSVGDKTVCELCCWDCFNIRYRDEPRQGNITFALTPACLFNNVRRYNTCLCTNQVCFVLYSTVDTAHYILQVKCTAIWSECRSKPYVLYMNDRNAVHLT